jgi:hypothetical protein
VDALGTSPDDTDMNIRCVLAFVLVAACSSSDNGATTADAPTGPACTGAIYDNCTTNDQCMSQNCHFFDKSNFTVCITTCTAGDNTTCPIDSSGNHATCNNMGLCKPAAANNCTR